MTRLKPLMMRLPIFLTHRLVKQYSCPTPMITGESYEELEELIESSGNRFLRFPTKYDIHECSIMENFVYSLPAGAARQELANAICGRGAFRRFKNGIRYHRLEQQWYDYRDQAYREIAIRWCRDEGLEYTEEN